MECTICNEDFDDGKLAPVIGTCGHSLCKKCRSLNEVNKNRCPNCRTENAFEKEVINYLIIEHLIKMKEIKAAVLNYKQEYEARLQELIRIAASHSSNSTSQSSRISFLENRIQEQGNEIDVFQQQIEFLQLELGHTKRKLKGQSMITEDTFDGDSIYKLTLKEATKGFAKSTWNPCHPTTTVFNLTSVCACGAGDFVAASGSNGINLFISRNDKPALFHFKSFSEALFANSLSMSLRPNSTELAFVTNQDPGTLVVFDMLKKTFPVKQRQAHNIVRVLSSRFAVVAVTDLPRKAIVYSRRTSKLEFLHSDEVASSNCVSLSAGGTLAYATSLLSVIQLFNAHTATIGDTIQKSGIVLCLALNSSGSLLATKVDDFVEVMDVADRVVLMKFVSPFITSMSFSLDNACLSAFNNSDFNVWVFNLYKATSQHVLTLKIPENIGMVEHVQFRHILDKKHIQIVTKKGFLYLYLVKDDDTFELVKSK